MPTTETITPSPKRTDPEPTDTDIPTRDEATEELLDKTDELLDEIDGVLDTETIEHVMTLADLIRKGSQRRPQIYGQLCDGRGTCALGAAIDEASHRGWLHNL